MNDIIVTKPTNRNEWMEGQWNHAHTSVLAKKGTRIYVKTEFTCMVCNEPFLALPFEFFCSERCMDIADIQEDEARVE